MTDATHCPTIPRDSQTMPQLTDMVVARGARDIPHTRAVLKGVGLDGYDAQRLARAALTHADKRRRARKEEK